MWDVLQIHALCVVPVDVADAMQVVPPRVVQRQDPGLIVKAGVEADRDEVCPPGVPTRELVKQANGLGGPGSPGCVEEQAGRPVAEIWMLKQDMRGKASRGGDVFECEGLELAPHAALICDW